MFPVDSRPVRGWQGKSQSYLAIGGARQYASVESSAIVDNFARTEAEILRLADVGEREDAETLPERQKCS